MQGRLLKISLLSLARLAFKRRVVLFKMPKFLFQLDEFGTMTATAQQLHPASPNKLDWLLTMPYGVMQPVIYNRRFPQTAIKKFMIDRQPKQATIRKMLALYRLKMLIDVDHDNGDVQVNVILCSIRVHITMVLLYY
jgi:hypothetical protein